jgi:hypothetical protein
MDKKSALKRRITVTLFDFIAFYWYMFIALFTPNDAKKWEKMAMENAIFAGYQTTNNRNQYWLSLSFRDRKILVEYVLIATIGKAPENLQNSMLEAMHTAAIQGKLVANK